MNTSEADDRSLARLVWETERAVVLELEAEHGRQPGSIPYAEHYEDEPAEFHQVCEAVAAAVLAAGFVRPEDVAEGGAR